MRCSLKITARVKVKAGVRYPRSPSKKILKKRGDLTEVNHLDLPKMMESGRRISVETTHVLKIKT